MKNYEIKLWKEALKKEKKKLEKIIDREEKSPINTIIKTHEEISEISLNCKSVDELVESSKRLKKLNNILSDAKAKHEKYDYDKDIKDRVDKELLIIDIESKINFLELNILKTV